MIPIEKNSVHQGLLSLTDSDSPFLDSYRRLYRKILYFNQHDNIKSIAITSAQVAEGKTLTSLNLALSMAEDKTKKVVLMDCDFRGRRSPIISESLATRVLRML